MLDDMAMPIELPAETTARLQAEADRRGVSVAAVIADYADTLPPERSREPKKLAFLGAGESAHGITPRIDKLLADGFGRD